MRSSRPSSRLASCSRKNARRLELSPNDSPRPLPRKYARERFSSIVRFGAVPAIGSWKTRPTTFARLCSGWRETFLPSMEMVPESTINRPEIELSNVDFPAPLEPITVTKSPGFRCRETSTSALRSLAVPAKKVLEMLSILSIGYLPPGDFRRPASQLRQQQRGDDKHCGNQLHVVRIQAHRQRHVDDQAVENGAQRNRADNQPQATLRDNSLADNDRCQADQDEADTHGDIREALELRNQRATQANQTIRQCEGQRLGEVSGDTERGNHLLIITCSAQRQAEVGGQEPHDECNQRDGADDQQADDSPVIFDAIERGKHGVLAQQRDIRTAHNAQVDQPQANHGQDTREQAVNLALGVQQAGDDAGDKTRNETHARSEDGINTVGNEHAGGSSTGGETAVNG